MSKILISIVLISILLLTGCATHFESGCLNAKATNYCYRNNMVSQYWDYNTDIFEFNIFNCIKKVGNERTGIKYITETFHFTKEELTECKLASEEFYFKEKIRACKESLEAEE